MDRNITKQNRLSLTMGLIVVFASVVSGNAAEPIDIGSRRELFVDDHLIERISGTGVLRLHHPIPREVSIVHDAPWEGTASGSHTVFQDGDRYRMYYRGWNFWFAKGMLHFSKPVTCYAESKDGIHWKKPDLGLVEFEGSKKNNIIRNGIGGLNFAPFIDHNPACPPEARYKAVGGVLAEGGMHVFKSKDGIRWSPIQQNAVLTKGPFDSVNLAFWDSMAGKYRAYRRWITGGRRAIRTISSHDLIHWQQAADLTFADSPKEELYENRVFPYPRAPHILLGLPTRYIERGWSPSMKALPDPEDRAERAALSERFGTALTETLLMASRDGVHFKRWNEAFLRPGAQRPGTWQYGNQHVAWQIVETRSALPGAAPELSIYGPERYWKGKGGVLRRYTLRMDGFVSASAGWKGGQLLTKPLVFDGTALEINFSTSAAGSLRIEIQDQQGTPIDGFRLSDCPVMFGDTIDRRVTWTGGAALSALAGKAVRLCFELKDADLYSFRFTR
tara:strand:- start:12159 stop:13667 length:1509 start_codon:yes stop_codon:yes gene_type:complete